MHPESTRADHGEEVADVHLRGLGGLCGRTEGSHGSHGKKIGDLWAVKAVNQSVPIAAGPIGRGATVKMWRRHDAALVLGLML